MQVGVATIGGVSTGTAPKTLIQLIAAANHGIELAEMHIGFHGLINSHKPITVTLERQDGDGTMSELTLVKNNDSVTDSLDTTAQHTATVEPTSDGVVRTWTVHPQTGLSIAFPADTRPKVGAGDRMGLVVHAENDVTADACLVFRE